MPRALSTWLAFLGTNEVGITAKYTGTLSRSDSQMRCNLGGHLVSALSFVLHKQNDVAPALAEDASVQS
jgi:hypothetical protein